MKKLTFPLLLATALVAASCSNEENINDGYDADAGKYLIELSGVGDNAMSRAGFTGADTKLMVHYVSTRKATDESTFPYSDGEGKGTLYMSSSATAKKDNAPTPESYSVVEQTTGSTGTKRYWDDIHGKNSILSLYAIAVPNKTELSNTTNKVYFDGTSSNVWSTMVKEGSETTMAHDLPWVVSATQTSATVDDEDITYSNNVSGDGKTLGFIHSDKKFEKAENAKTLIFNHALSRVSINVKKGEGFGDFSTEFKITSAKLLKQTTGGTLNVTTGEWTSSATNKDVDFVGTSKEYKDGETQIGYSFCAQVLPNVTLKDVDDTMLSFTVDGNIYNITGKEIYTSLIANNSGKEAICSKLNAGYNYNLSVTIKKTGIEIASAKLVDWEKIEGDEMTPSNAIALTIDMEKEAGDKNTTIASDLYRSETLATGYTATGNKTTLSYDSENSKFVMGNIWYWPDNDTKYYFRTISPQGTTVANATNDNIAMAGGAIDATNDFIWGAPLVEEQDCDHKFTYSNGYGTYLYDAIGATKSEIHITQFHMMSNIEVNLTTSDGGDAVTLTDATVEILNYDNSATLALSNAAIKLSGSKTETSGAITTTDHLKHTWRVIPQTTSDITFKITAAGNVYVVNLPAETGIDAWAPGKSYVYNFKLLKTAIQVTSAKLVDWETVTAADKTVTLE